MCVWGCGCRCGCVLGWGGGGTEVGARLPPLRLELQAEADLVAAGVDVLPVEESGQRQLDPCGDATGQRSRLSLSPIV